MKRRWTVACAIWLASSCGPTPPPEYAGEGAGSGGSPSDKPVWVDSASSPRYPHSSFLSGVGHGPERAACEHDARAAIAKILSARIEQESSDWQRHFSQVNAAGQVQVEAMAVSQLARVSTDHVLKGSQIAEVWHGPAAFHCLAVLDRSTAARRLRDEIDRLDVQIATKVDDGDEAPNTTARFFAYKRAMELLQRREALNSELRLIGPTHAGKPPLHGWKQLVAKFTGARAGIKIGLKLAGQDADHVQTCLAEQLGQRGIQVLEDTSDVDLMVHGKLRWRWAGKLMGSYMVKTDLNLRITDVQDGKTVSAFSESLKTGRPQKAMALQSASHKLCSRVAPPLAERIEKALTDR